MGNRYLRLREAPGAYVMLNTCDVPFLSITHPEYSKYLNKNDGTVCTQTP